MGFELHINKSESFTTMANTEAVNKLQLDLSVQEEGSCVQTTHPVHKNKISRLFMQTPVAGVPEEFPDIVLPIKRARSIQSCVL